MERQTQRHADRETEGERQRERDRGRKIEAAAEVQRDRHECLWIHERFVHFWPCHVAVCAPRSGFRV